MTESLTRIDPKSRAVDGDRNSGIRLLNADHRRHYVLANPNDEDTGLSFYENLGYTIETLRKDGPRFSGGRTSKEGDKVTRSGQVLVSCPIEEYEAQELAKLHHASQVDRRSKSPGGVDGVQGSTGRLAAIDPKSELIVPTRS